VITRKPTNPVSAKPSSAHSDAVEAGEMPALDDNRNPQLEIVNPDD